MPTDVVVRDGSTVCLRPASGTDADAVRSFLGSLSSESLYFRFLGLPALTVSRVRALLEAPGSTAMVAETAGRIAAFASFHRDPAQADRAEVAFAVSDAVQGHGIGTRLLERLADVARSQGVRTFDAYVLGTNRRMLDVFQHSGFAVTTAIDHGVFHVAVSLSLTPRFEESTASRSQIAATASMTPFFAPRAIAVIGANRDRGRIGSEILHNLIAAGFPGGHHPGSPDSA